jgi:dTDP-4-dehydrorhamnose 3,5-epimerase
MLFTETKVRGAFLIDIERRQDERGYFARTFCQREFAALGLNPRIAQLNWSRNISKGTLRGMHYQIVPHQEAKVISCARGAMYDVVLDLRVDSPSYRTWAAAELTAENRRMLSIPEGCAHGFQTLADDTEVLYLMSEFYSPAQSRGIRFDDPAFQIEWLLPVSCISDADRYWPDFDSEQSQDRK